MKNYSDLRQTITLKACDWPDLLMKGSRCFFQDFIRLLYFLCRISEIWKESSTKLFLDLESARNSARTLIFFRRSRTSFVFRCSSILSLLSLCFSSICICDTFWTLPCCYLFLQSPAWSFANKFSAKNEGCSIFRKIWGSLQFCAFAPNLKLVSSKYLCKIEKFSTANVKLL